MYRAVEALFRRFPEIARDIRQADKDTAPLIEKLRKVRPYSFTIHTLVNLILINRRL